MEEKNFIFCFLTLGKFTPPFGTCECLDKSSELLRNVMLHEELKEKKSPRHFITAAHSSVT